jgi:hypothetical protein
MFLGTSRSPLLLGTFISSSVADSMVSLPAHIACKVDFDVPTVGFEEGTFCTCGRLLTIERAVVNTARNQ